MALSQFTDGTTPLDAATFNPIVTAVNGAVQNIAQRVYSDVKTDGSNQTTTLQSEIDNLWNNGTGGGELILPGGTIIADVKMRHRVSLIGQGKNITILKSPAGSTATGCVTLDTGPVQNAWLKGLNIAGNGNTGQHGIYLIAVGAGTNNNGGWWNSGMESVLVSGFTGDQIWLAGGGTNALTPHQFLTFRDVEAYIGTGITRVALRLTGQVGQTYFLGHCEFDGPGQSNAGTNIDIRRQCDANLVNLSDEAPYTILFIGTTSQSNGSAVSIERASDIVLEGCYFENISQGIHAFTSAPAVFVKDCIFGNVGSNGGAGYAIKAESSATAYALRNVFNGAADKHFINSNGTLIQRESITLSAASPITSGMTMQYSIATDGSLSTGLNTQAVVNSSTTQLITLTSGLGVGETLTIKALNGTVVVNSTGNIDPAGKTMPYTIPSGASMTFQKQDLLGTPWFIQSASA